MPSAVLQVKQRLEKLATYETSKPAQAITALALFRAAWGGDPDPWQADILHSTSKRLFLNCSRQSGKSTTTSVLAVNTAIQEPHSLILIFSPTDRQSGLLFKKCRDVYDATPGLPALTARRERSMEFANGSSIVSLPGKPDNVRGFSAPRLVIIDEAAFASDALYRAVRPMLAVSHGTLALLSSPFGRRGFYYHEYETIMQQGSASPWQYVEVPATQVPRISAEFLAEEKISLGPLYPQEYLCQFVDSTLAMFDHQAIVDAMDEGVELWI